MLNLRRNRFAFACLAIVALVGSVIAGTVARAHLIAAGGDTAVDSVLGAVPICHQPNAAQSGGEIPTPDDQSSPQHDCPGCLTGHAALYALPSYAEGIDPPAIAAAVSPSSPPPHVGSEAPMGSVGSRGPPSSI